MDPKKVLVIDDEFPVRYLVEHQLKRNGYEAISAKDGPTGIKAAQTHKPDLIVLDIMMPKMNGFEVCEEIRNDPAIAATPVIFLTACMTRKHKLRAFEIGADDYLVKPFQPDELLAHITAVLRRAGEPNQASDIAPNGGAVQGASPKKQYFIPLNIKQYYTEVNKEDRMFTLFALLDSFIKQKKSIIVFCNSVAQCHKYVYCLCLYFIY